MEHMHFWGSLLYVYSLLAFNVVPIDAGRARVLIYSATKGFRHDSIPTAIEQLKAHGGSIDVDFDATENPSQFTSDNLARYDTILFLSTTGEVLDEGGEAAFQNYLNLGGTFVGIHSASDSLRNAAFYANELGALFDYHPVLQNFTIDVLDESHPSTKMLPVHWQVQDEPYNFQSDPRALDAVVVLSADDQSYIDDGIRRFDQGTPHPTAWFQEKGAGVVHDGLSVAGRSFYTSLGHLNETWQDELFMSHVLGGISWVLLGNTTLAFNPTGLVGNSQSQPSAIPSATSTITGAPPANSQNSRNTATPPTKSMKVLAFTLACFIALIQCVATCF